MGFGVWGFGDCLGSVARRESGESGIEFGCGTAGMVGMLSDVNHAPSDVPPPATPSRVHDRLPFHLHPELEGSEFRVQV